MKSNRSEIRITLHEHAAILETSEQKLVDDCFTIRSKTEHFAPRRHFHQIFCRKADGEFVFPAGLVKHVADYFGNRGFRVKIKNQTKWELLHVADISVFNDENLPPEERELAKRLSQNPRGQILAANFDDIAAGINIMVELHHNAQIIVVVKNNDAVKSIFHRLREIVRKHRVLDTRKKFRSHIPSIVITTRNSFESGSGDPFHFVVFADVESALTTDKELLHDNWRNCAWYFFRNPTINLHPRELFELEAIFGPVIFDFNNDGRGNSFHVRFVNFVGEPHTAKLRGLDRKRFMYWHDDGWNRSVVETAFKYSRRNSTSPGAGKDPKDRETKTLAIVVESPEHAAKLSTMLPGWTVKRHNEPTTAIPNLANKEIGTMSYADRWGFAVDVLVRADGGAGWPFPQNFFVGYHNQSSEVLLVDFFDERDRTAVRDTNSRIRDYSSSGWKIRDLAESQGFHHDELKHGGEEQQLKSIPTNDCPDILSEIHIS